MLPVWVENGTMLYYILPFLSCRKDRRNRTKIIPTKEESWGKEGKFLVFIILLGDCYPQGGGGGGGVL